MKKAFRFIEDAHWEANAILLAEDSETSCHEANEYSVGAQLRAALFALTGRDDVHMMNMDTEACCDEAIAEIRAKLVIYNTKLESFVREFSAWDHAKRLDYVLGRLCNIGDGFRVLELSEENQAIYMREWVEVAFHSESDDEVEIEVKVCSHT